MATLYLPGLNGVRALAALIVLFSHIWQFQYWFGFGHPTSVPYKAASLGVTLFFVLSGYLITYLLILEKEWFKTIALRKFYLRRILRIWPLYYLILTGSVLLVNNDSTACTLYCFFLLPNLSVALACLSPIIVPLWSIGVEEQFYLCWPVLIKFSNQIIWSLLVVLFLYLSVKLTIRFTGSETLYTFIGLTRIDCMAIGGLGAWWANSSNRIAQQFIFNKATQIILWLILLAGCSGQMLYMPSLIEQELYAIVFAIIILNVSKNPRPVLSLENSILDWVGKISYGVYLWHMLVLYLLSKLIQDKLAPTSLGLIFYFMISVSVVLMIASLSYKYFEQFFIQAKRRLMVVQSESSKPVRAIAEEN
jgi:peptidoglycan/LPS O-acetylase OafA/YrhL